MVVSRRTKEAWLQASCAPSHSGAASVAYCEVDGYREERRFEGGEWIVESERKWEMMSRSMIRRDVGLSLCLA